MTRRLASVVAAAVVLAGLAVAVVPQHAASIAALAAGTVAAVAAALLLVLAGPLVATRPGPWPPTATPDRPAPLDPQGLRDARRRVRARLAAGASIDELLGPADPHDHGGPR